MNHGLSTIELSLSVFLLVSMSCTTVTITPHTLDLVVISIISQLSTNAKKITFSSRGGLQAGTGTEMELELNFSELRSLFLSSARFVLL